MTFLPKVDSPCVNVCEMGDHGYCKGCFRTLDELVDWEFLDNGIKLSILNQLSERKKKHESEDPIDYSVWYEGK